MATTDYKGGFRDGQIAVLGDIIEALNAMLDRYDEDPAVMIEDYAQALDEQRDALERDRD